MSFDKGQYSMGSLPSRHVAQRDMRSHTRLKLRRFGGESAENLEARLKKLKEDLQEREKALQKETESIDTNKPVAEVSVEHQEYDDDDEVLSRPSSSSSDEDDAEPDKVRKITSKLGQETDTALKRELLRVQKERQAREALGLPLSNVNPLLERNSGIQRKWDDDVIFKNQAKPEQARKEQRFVNDIVHSDKHKGFLKKFVI